MVKPDCGGVFKGRDLVLVPTVGTYIELRYIKHFSAKKCQNFEGMGRAPLELMLWCYLTHQRASQVFPTGVEVDFSREKKSQIYKVMATIKQ